MDFNIIYNKIIEKLLQNNRNDVIVELENADEGASTGTESLMMKGYYLKHIKNTDPYLYDMLAEEIKDFLEYCKSIGLRIG